MAKPGRTAAGNQTAREPSEADQLRAQLEALRGENATLLRERDDATTKRVQAEQAGMSEVERRLAAEIGACDTQMTTLDSEGEALESQIAALADEPGHGKEIASLTRKLSQNTTARAQQEQRKQWLEGQAQVAKNNREQAGKQPTGRLLADGRSLDMFDPSTRSWFEKHPQSFTDKDFLERASAAAMYASSVKKLAPRSQEYYDFVEQELGLKQAPVEEDDEFEQGEDLGGIVARRRAEADQGPYSQPRDTRQSQPANRQKPAGGDLDYDVQSPQSRAAGPGAIATPVSRQIRQPGERRQSRRTPDLSAEEREVADNLYAELAPAERYTRYAENRAYMAARQPQRLN